MKMNPEEIVSVLREEIQGYDTRVRREETGNPEVLHTRAGTDRAPPRFFPAMVEQNQRADGSIVVPEVLRKYLGGIEVIEKK